VTTESTTPEGHGPTTPLLRVALSADRAALSARRGTSLRGDSGRRDSGPSRLIFHLQFEHSGWKAIVVLVLVAGLTISFASTWAWYAYTSSLSHQAVASSLAEVKSILGTTLERDSDLLATVNAVVATHPQITNAELAAILSKLDLSSATREASPSPMSRTSVVQTAGVRSDSCARSSLGGDSRRPGSGEGLAQRPIRLLPDAPGRGRDSRGGDPQERPVGLDLAYISAHFNFCASSFVSLFDTSAKTGASVASSLVSLIRPAPGLPDIPETLHSLLLRLPIFLELSPVYSGTRVPTTTRTRARALAGWTMAVFDADQILSPALVGDKTASLYLLTCRPEANRQYWPALGDPNRERPRRL